MSDALLNPRLLVISGPNTGAVYSIPMDGVEVTAGRAADNAICILDPLASKHHFALRWEGDRTKLYDRKTAKGTKIDRKYYIHKDMKHGERIMAGTTALIYLLHPDPLDAVENLKDEIDKERYRTQTAETLRVQEPAREEETLYYRDVWKALWDTSRYVNAIPDLNELQVRILDTAFDIIPARRGAILLNGFRLSPDPPDLTSQVYRELDYDGAPRCLLSSLDSLALSSVYATRKTYISNKVIPVLCLPILQDGIMKGVLYFDAPRRNITFEAEHLSLASAFTENLTSALALQRKIEHVQNHRDLLLEAHKTEQPIIGKSPAIQRVLTAIAKAAAFDVTVLIYGETGTGKELVAQAIHRLSARRDNPFAAVNCGGIPENLLLSELFGHAKGAFTGAVNARKGKFRQAEGGTVFLDEMGELPLDLQAALLRVLQEKKADPVGEDKPVDINVRIIAATNVNLEKAVESGKFRRDLYYRLNVVTIHVPPLRERVEDIPALVDYFLQKHCDGNATIAIAPEAMDALFSYSWPGNVRELENAIQAAIVNIYRTSNVIRVEDLPKCIRSSGRADISSEIRGIEHSRNTADAVLLARLQHRMIENGGNVRDAAAAMGIGKTKAYALLRETTRNSEPPADPQ